MSRVTLRPAKVLTDNVVEITATAREISLRLCEYVEEMRLLSRHLGYSWKSPYWKREITQFNGPLDDRLIEAAYKLLNKGFIISLPADYQARVVEGDFIEEHTRWIFKRQSGAYEGWFAICWARHEDFYNAARRLRGSRYSKPAVIIPPGQYEEVRDFAQLYDFRFSPAAEAVAEQAALAREMEVRVELRPRQAKAAARAETVITGEIADELRDDD